VSCSPASSPSASTSPTFSSTLPIDTSSTQKTVEVSTNYSSSATVNPAGGSGRFDLTATGLPSGLTATAGGSEIDISGVPTEVGTFTVTFSLTEVLAPYRSGTATFTLTVYAPTPVGSVSGPATATVGQSYSGGIDAVGGYGTSSSGSTPGAQSYFGRS
jgi:hypothetical protein